MRSRKRLLPSGFGATTWGGFNARNRACSVKIDEPVKLLQSDTGSNQSDYEGVIMATAILLPKDAEKKKTQSQWFERRFFESIGKVKITCAVCERPMWLPKSKSEEYKTCGPECAKGLRESAKAARAKICVTCGKEFSPRPEQLRKGHGNYCSQACNKSHVFMNTQTAQKLARENWKARHKENPIIKHGSGNPRWSGGLEAKKQRDRMAGWPVQAARRAKTKKKFDAEFLLKLCELQRWKCVCCGASLKHKKHLDHIVPLSKGGQHHELNVQFLCPTCNMKKHSKDSVVFMQEQGFLL